MAPLTLSLLAFLGLGILTVIGLSCYWFGWWQRGRHEAQHRDEYRRQLRRQWQWEQERADEAIARLRRGEGPPKLRAVE